MVRVVNRVLLGLVGLALLCTGGGLLATGLGVSVPSWWPYTGRKDVLLSEADRHRWREQGWWWPVVIAVLTVVVLLTLWWLLSQLRRARLGEVRVDSGDGQDALLRGRALENVLQSEAAALDGVSQARVRLTGRRSTPEARVRLLLEPHASPGRALEGLTVEAVAHARGSAGLDSLPTEARLRAAKHRGRRVT